MSGESATSKWERGGTGPSGFISHKSGPEFSHRAIESSQVSRIIPEDLKDEIYFPYDWDSVHPGDLLVSKSGTKRVLLTKDLDKAQVTFLVIRESKRSGESLLVHETRLLGAFPVDAILYAVKEHSEEPRDETVVLDSVRYNHVLQNVRTLVELGPVGKQYAKVMFDRRNDTRGTDLLRIEITMDEWTGEITHAGLEKDPKISGLPLYLVVRTPPRPYKNCSIIGVAGEPSSESYFVESLKYACLLANKLRK